MVFAYFKFYKKFSRAEYLLKMLLLADISMPIGFNILLFSLNNVNIKFKDQKLI